MKYFAHTDPTIKFSVFQLGVCDWAKTGVALQHIPKFAREKRREQKCKEERNY